MTLRPPDAPCHGLALYEWQGRLDVAAWLQLALTFFSRLGAQPDTGGVRQADGRDLHLEGAALRRWLEQPVAAGPPLLSASLFATVLGYTQLAFGWWVMAEFSITANGDRRSAFWGWRADLPLGLEDATDDLVRPLAAQLHVPYGIGYTLPFRRGPGLDALGLSAGLGYTPDDKLEAKRVSNWFHERMGQQRHVRGLLRDVYPVNLISEPHLCRMVDGRPLGDWITADPGRGRLSPLVNGLWRWTLGPEQVPSVREALTRADLLIAELPRPGA